MPGKKHLNFLLIAELRFSSFLRCDWDESRIGGDPFHDRAILVSHPSDVSMSFLLLAEHRRKHCRHCGGEGGGVTFNIQSSRMRAGGACDSLKSSQSYALVAVQKP